MGIAGPLPALGQAEAPLVTISQVDSQAYPSVSATLKVTDALGNAIPDLAAADFGVLVEGAPVPNSNFTLNVQNGEPLSLVLALDASVQWSSFRQVQAAAKAFVDTLGSQDQVAIVAFSETVEVAQNFTNNKETLKGTIDSLVATGLYTALNDAALKAVNVASTAPTAKRAVIIVTNSGDTSGDSSATAAVTQATAAQLPIYTLGYGDNAATDSLHSISDSTGGKAYDLPDASALTQTLPTVEDGLRDVSYVLTFRSGLKPDNQNHTFAVAVTKDGVTGQATGSYVAVSHTVDVKVPGIEDGQAVVGKVYLVAEVQSASPIASVDYLLNGQPIASVTSAPYSFEWDSTTVNPGTYQLTVRASDAGGNQGEKSITVSVSLPFSVQINAATNRAQVGDDFSLDAKVNTPAQIARVVLLIDDQEVATDTTQPYHFTFNTKSFAVGEHTIVVRAIDVLGRSAESTLPVRLTEAWLPIVVRWAFAGLIVIAILVTLIVGLGLARSVAAAQEKRLCRAIRVEIANQGNARSRYELRADDPINALGFEFSLNGSTLAQRQAVESVPVGAGTSPDTLVAAPAVASAPATAAADGAFKEKGGGAVKSAKGALGLASSFGGALITVGQMLPPGMGNGLVSMGYQMRGGEYALSRAEHEVKAVQDVTSGKGMHGHNMSAPAVSRPVPTGTAPTPKAATTPVAAPGLMRVWSQTPVVEPGQTLAVTLTLRPLKSRHTQQYFFRVLSQAVDGEGVPATIEQGNVQIKGLSFLSRLLPLVILLAMLVIMALLVGLLLVNLGLFG
jgi:VWFA-related protein